MSILLKTPEALLDFGVDWGAWLGVDTIAASAWDVQTPLVIEDEVFDNKVARVRVSGGVKGQLYKMVNRITTAAGRKDSRTLNLRCEEREL